MDMDKVARQYDEVLAMAVNICQQQRDVARDLTQDLMLKLTEMERREGNLARVLVGGKINKGFIYTALRNNYIDWRNKEGRLAKDARVPEGQQQPISSTELDVRTRLRQLDALAGHEHYGQYYEKLFHTFVLEGHTYRSFQAATQISVSTVFYEMKFLKAELRKYLKQ